MYSVEKLRNQPTQNDFTAHLKKNENILRIMFTFLYYTIIMIMILLRQDTFQVNT